jgi:hypothetical protein
MLTTLLLQEAAAAENSKAQEEALVGIGIQQDFQYHLVLL